MTIPNKMRKTPKYTDEQQAEFCDLAKEIGIGRAVRQLGYPTWAAGAAWMKKRGIEPNNIETFKTVRAYHTYYQVEDILVTFDNAIAVAEEMLISAESPDDLQRISNALYKIVQTRQLLEGKATSISEKRELTQADLEILDLINVEKAKNAEIEAENSTIPESKERI